jgi:hypothetical protein
MAELMRSISKSKHLIVLGTLFLINFALFLVPGAPGNFLEVRDSPQDIQIPDIQGVYSVEDVNHFLNVIGEKGRRSYQTLHLTTDLIFPIIYALFISGLILRLNAHPATTLKESWHWMAFIAGSFDMAENFLMLYITGTYPAYHLRAITFAALCSFMKFACIFACVGILCFQLAQILIRLWQARLKKA